jgi:uncharacterized protein (TIGR03437 family)
VAILPLLATLAPGFLDETASAQTVAGPGVARLEVAESGTSWKRIAGTTVHEGLADPAGGPVSALWYSSSGNRLLVETAAGRIFETADFEHWHLNTSETAPAAPPSAAAATLPEPEARLQSVASRLYAVGRANVYASEDSGRTWLNLTGFNNRSVIGGGFTALAASPSNALEITAANRFGVWRSLDGGLSWRGLNEDLPNLMVRKLVNRRTVALADSTLIGFDSGAWTPVSGIDPDLSLELSLFARSRVLLSAVAQSGGMLYGGTADGRLLISRDNGASWAEAPRVVSAGDRLHAPIDRIWADSERPESALAAAGSHLLRTVNGGLFWDDVTGSLPQARIHGIAADRSAGVVYVATDRGVFSGSIPLNDAGPARPDWTAVSRDLPAAAAWDVRLNADNTLTVALDGYGVFETPAPHRTRGVRIVNGADMSDRAAAPGSLISVMGARVQQGRNGAVNYPVVAASTRSSQLQVPFEAAAGVFELALEGIDDRWTVPLTVKEASPAIFVDAEGAPLILDASSGLVVDPNVAVHAGSLVQVLATGLGKVTPDWPTGIPAPLDSPPSVRGAVTAYLDGTPLQVTRATLAPGYVGYYLVELQIPLIVNRGTSELRILMNGEASNRVKLYLEPDQELQ